MNDEFFKAGEWTTGENFVIEWMKLPEPPLFAAEYRRVALVYDQKDVPMLSASKKMYEALENTRSLLVRLDNMFDGLRVDGFHECIANINSVLQKARGGK